MHNFSCDSLLYRFRDCPIMYTANMTVRGWCNVVPLLKLSLIVFFLFSYPVPFAMTTKRVRISETEPVADHFRLYDLPFDLREYFSQFVDRRTAARLLTLSSGCHELFSRSVWRYIDESIFRTYFTKRSLKKALARYGRLVRRVHFRGILNRLDYSIDLSRQLPNVAVYSFEIGNHGASKKQALHLIKAVAGFHGLRSLEVLSGSNYHQICLEPLANALVSRQQNQNWQRLQRLKIVFIPNNDNCPWDDMTEFVSKVTPLQIDDFEITPKGIASEYPTAEQMALLAPHLTSIPSFSISEPKSACKARLNRLIYSPQNPSGNDEPVVFSHLKSISISLCCASSAVYDYVDFTPERFPQVEIMSITIFNCRQGTMSMYSTLANPVLNQDWPNLSVMFP
ncbi:hypothetical protein GQ42DRAFT_24895 [Ramicandelaber brevisporus]|nr:hypothetical protein GQ42DRAFT_24895 [Ramicandelaber brevisporus]